MSGQHPIAIVGIGGVFPAAADLDQFWSLVRDGVDTSREVPAGRWALDPALARSATPGDPDSVYSTRGCFLNDLEVQTKGLAVSSGWLGKLDPLFGLAIQAGNGALTDVTSSDLPLQRTGVVLGNIALPTDAVGRLGAEVLGRTFAEQLPAAAGWLDGNTDPLNRYVAGLPAGVMARALGLGGGSLALDAACASSLYALALASAELHAGRTDAMVSGGMSRASSLYTQMGFSQLRALSPSGHCSPFDARGDGLVVGEGAGMFVLKRLDDALAANDHIYGLIRGSGLSNDVGGSLLAPSSEGQLRAMRRAYQQAGWRPQQVDLIECHATGTPVGDAVEVESLRSLWGDQAWTPGQCVIGSVKSNVGHLLTGAGAAGLMKVLLALREETLPPTANFKAPSSEVRLEASPFQVLSEAQPWARRGPGIPRRAAVSAFGFGGINAHLLVEEWLPPREAPKTQSLGWTPSTIAAEASSGEHQQPNEAIAIVGMGAHFGPWSNLRSVGERLLGGGEEPPRDHPARRWWGVDRSDWLTRQGTHAQPPRGFPMDKLEIPLGHFRIPPRELEEMLPQQLLMLAVADAALQDAGWSDEDGSNAGVIVGLGLDLGTTSFQLRWMLKQASRGWGEGASSELEAWRAALLEAAGPALSANRTMGALGSVVASRIARELRFGGPSFALSSEEASGLRGLEVAMRALQRRDLDAAVVGAVDLTGDVRSLLSTHAGRAFSPTDTARPLDTQADGTVPGEGAAALVIRRLADAKARGDRIYAIIRGVGVSGGGAADSLAPDADAYGRALGQAYDDANLAPETVGYLELHGSGQPGEDRIEMQALGEFAALSKSEGVCVASSAKADIGHAGAAAGLASMVKASLCLYQEVLPPLRNLAERHVSLEACPALHTLGAPRYWLRDRATGPRRAGVSGFGVDGTCVHVVLEGHEAPTPTTAQLTERRQPLGARNAALFALEADDDQGLSAGLDALQNLTQRHDGLGVEALARLWWQDHGSSPEAPRALALVARSGDDLRQRIEAARAVIQPDAVSHAPRVFHTRTPLGPDAGLALVFPGSGNQFPGMGRDLSAQWPEILRAQDAENEALLQQYHPELCWDSRDPADLVADARTPIFGQVTLGTLVTDLLRRLGVTPQAAIGYSLGESASLFALRAWRHRDAMAERMRHSPLFTHDLAGACRAARTAWGLSDDEPLDWQVGVVDRTAVEVRAALDPEKRARLLIVNAPDECVVGGQRLDVDQLVERLGGQFLPLEGITTVHCEVAREVEEAYRELHLFETSAPAGVQFYSGAWGRSYGLDRDSAAGSITAQAIEGLDFPKVMEAAYGDGHRAFVEVGPGASCTRMIGKILGERPHLAMTACSPGSDAVETLLVTLGQLISHRFAVDLDALYGGESLVAGHLQPTVAPAATLTVPLGGEPFVAPPMPDTNPKPEASPKTDGEPNTATLPDTASIPAVDTSPSYTTEPDTGSVYPSDSANPMLAHPAATADAHETWLRFSQSMAATLSHQASYPGALVAAATASGNPSTLPLLTAPVARPEPTIPAQPPQSLDREACLRFATSKIAHVLGQRWATVDEHPTRVRLPDEPLMLVDRILSIEGEPLSMSQGRVVTEHDVLDDSWYLDGGRIPTCIAVEAGQADLFLSAWLGIDLETKGEAVYRLLDADVTFHGDLPGPGAVIHYDIHIDRMFRHGPSWFFHFHFDATCAGQPLLSMRNGCAGFFSDEDLAAGSGIVSTTLSRQRQPGKRPEDWRDLAPLAGVEKLHDDAVAALRAGDLAGCFGAAFANLGLDKPLGLPAGRMNLVDRVVELDPTGGRFGLGLIRAEMDVAPDDWFLTCHFVDDRVMPGTLMYECCLHTLRIFLMRLGWVGEDGQVTCQPVPGIASRLKCRGQVLETTRLVTYEVSVKELGYRPEPFAVVDALMYADGKPIVEITDMSLRLTGLSREEVEQRWARRSVATASASAEPTVHTKREPAIYDRDRILAFAVGKPSEAFGAPYLPFDSQRVIARLPGPPYAFIDRITAVEGTAFELAQGAKARAQYDIPPDAWYFASNRQASMPFAVLLEVGLQPCGWLAAWLGSALTSEENLCFRNLGGKAVQHRPVLPGSEILTTDVTLTRLSHSGGMIIQHYDLAVHDAAGPVYEGNTYFGFFSHAALAQQLGVRDYAGWEPDSGQASLTKPASLPDAAPFPDQRLRMVDSVDLWLPEGGPQGLGFIQGSKQVDPGEWFFAAHFHQDPVWPGSLGLEAFIQLLKVVAAERWGTDQQTRFEAVAPGEPHQWSYRGQVIPSSRQVTVSAAITAIDDDQRLLRANGCLRVDGLVIYEMQDFTLQAVAP